MKNIKFKQYNRKYFYKCIKLVKETWNFHNEFSGLKDENLVYEYYFRSCLNWNTHLEIIVDEDDEVKGLLFGSIEDDSYINERKYRREEKILEKWLKKNINRGKFGNPLKANQIFNFMKSNDYKGEKYAYLFDSEINLFIVSSEMRGQGLGIELMDHYIEFCKLNKLKKAFLWSDEGCSYTFYEKYGFKLHSRFTEHDKEVQSGMIYYIDIV